MPLQKWSDKIWIVSLAGDPAFSDDMELLLGQLQSAEPAPDVVLDLSSVDHLNSSNLSQMLRIRKMLMTGASRMRVVGPQDSVWAVFLTTGLDKVFDFKADTSTALADLQID